MRIRACAAIASALIDTLYALGSLTEEQYRELVGHA